MPPTRKIYKLVLKYESQHNSRISIGSWEEIFQQLGCLEEFKGIMKKFNHLGSKYIIHYKDVCQGVCMDDVEMTKLKKFIPTKEKCTINN